MIKQSVSTGKIKRVDVLKTNWAWANNKNQNKLSTASKSQMPNHSALRATAQMKKRVQPVISSTNRKILTEMCSQPMTMIYGMSLILLWQRSKPQKSQTWKFQRATSKMMSMCSSQSADWRDRVICGTANVVFWLLTRLSSSLSHHKTPKKAIISSTVTATMHIRGHSEARSSQKTRWRSKARKNVDWKELDTLIVRDLEWAVEVRHLANMSEFKPKAQTVQISQTS